MGVDAVAKSQLKFYPNPVTDVLKVENAKEGDRIELYDVNGRLVLQSKVEATQTELQLQAISKGIYFLKKRYGYQQNFEAVISSLSQRICLISRVVASNT